MNTFNSFCIAACMFLIFFGMAIGFVGAIGAFPVSMTTGFTPGNSIGTITNLTGNVTGTTGHLDFYSIWGIATGATTVGAIALAILTKSTNMIGVWLFGSFFWSSWASMVGLFYLFDFLKTGAGAILIMMITVGMIIIFVGAVIGMLSGSIWMR